MKKVVISIIMFLALTQIIFAEDITIEINDEVIVFEEPPLIVDDRTMVPLKFLMDTLGYQISWNAETYEVTATRNIHEMKLTIGEETLLIDGEAYISDVAPIIIHDRTYVPLAIITRATGADVSWIDETRTVVVFEKISYLNMFYGKGAYKNYSEIEEQLNSVDQIVYAWSRVEMNNGEVLLNTTSINDNMMFYPDGHELVMGHKSPKLLNIYADQNYSMIFAQSEQLIQDIKTCLLSPVIDEPEFDGVVIDFENLKEDNFEEYVQFIEALDKAIPTMTLDVAVQPRAFSYERVLPYVDHMILMLHDYESKSEVIINFNQNYVEQPISPLESIKEDLDQIVKSIPPWDRDKLILQINLSVVQWQGDTLYEVKRYTPGYQKLIDRMKKLTFSDFYYDQIAKNPFLHYVDENKTINTIWYENETSLQEKINLVFDYDLGGISIWQIGNLPSFENIEAVDKYQINLWQKILENN